MDTKEVKDAIMFLENCIHRGEEDDLQAYEVKYNYWIKKIIVLLERGEKFKQMWEEFKEKCGDVIIEPIEGEVNLNNAIREIEQKYFPKIKSSDELSKLVGKLREEIDKHMITIEELNEMLTPKD